MATTTRCLPRTCKWLLLIFAALSQPAFASSATISEIDIQPIPGGDLLLITYEGELNTLLMLVGDEKHATLKLSPASITQSFRQKNFSGRLVRSLKLVSSPLAETKIEISLKRRLGSHYKQRLLLREKKVIQVELLDEVAEKPPKPSDKSIIQPLTEKGIFKVDGSKKKKLLDYNNSDRNKITTDEFLSLFGTQVIPRPNRITNISYQLIRGKLTVLFSLHQRPSYSLKSYQNPSRIKLTMNRVLGDFEILHHLTQHDFLGDLTSTRNIANSLTMQVNLYETAEASGRVIKNPTGPGYQLIINIERIYPWETESAIPEIDI